YAHRRLPDSSRECSLQHGGASHSPAVGPSSPKRAWILSSDERAALEHPLAHAERTVPMRRYGMSERERRGAKRRKRHGVGQVHAVATTLACTISSSDPQVGQLPHSVELGLCDPYAGRGRRRETGGGPGSPCSVPVRSRRLWHSTTNTSWTYRLVPGRDLT